LADQPRYTPLHDPALAVLERLDLGVWISDADEARIVWANRAALAIWRAPDLDELINRPNNNSETARVTLRHVRERVSGGLRIKSDRTIYPNGVPTLLHMTMSAYQLPDGRGALFVEAIPHTTQIDPDVLRASEAVRYAPLWVSTHAIDGTTLTANAAARKAFGSHFHLRDIFVEASSADEALQALGRRGPFSAVIAARTTSGQRWYEVEARPITDPVSGALAVAISGHDVTARVEADLYKDEFLAIVNHELRTPLTAIHGALELLDPAITGPLPEPVGELIAIARDSTARLRRVVEDLLDARQIAARALDLRLAPLDLRPAARQALEAQRPVADLAGVALALTPDGGAPLLVDADESRIAQVLANLLSNAIRHAPPGSTVELRVEAAGDQARVSVIDQGPGVPEAFRGRLFQRFSQVNASTTRPVGGVGLGLFLSRTIVEAHGGHIGYEPRVPGALFFVELPVKMGNLPEQALP